MVVHDYLELRHLEVSGRGSASSRSAWARQQELVSTFPQSFQGCLSALLPVASASKTFAFPKPWLFCLLSPPPQWPAGKGASSV